MSTTAKEQTNLTGIPVVSKEDPFPANQILWAGFGEGRICQRCGHPIERAQVQFEVEVDTPEGRQTFFLHKVCYTLGEWITAPDSDPR